MKIKILKKLKEAGTALLVAMVLGGILCVSIVGYLSVAEQQNFLSMRSQSWNMAITVVEAGIEEGIEHLNVYPTNPGQDGWTYDGTWYTHSTTLPNGDGYTVYATITNAQQPVIIARATVYSPTLFAKASSGFFFAAAGVNQSTVPVNVTRAVQVKTQRGMLFTKAMVARNTIDMNGNNISTDSFDSGNPFYSNYGKYDPNRPRSNGDIASNATIINSINVGQANIYGHVQTGPNGTVSIGNNGGIGSYAWQSANKGVEPNGTEGDNNWLRHDANFSFPDTTLPDTSGFSTYLPAAGDVSMSSVVINSNYVGSSSTYPTPPPWSGVTTNSGWVTNSSYPGAYSGLVTNVGSSQTFYACPSYPAAGTYVGAVVTNAQFQSDRNLPAGCYYGAVPHGTGGKYDYWQVNGWYVYKINSYAYPVTSYNYATYTTNVIWVTNHYDHVFTGPGNTIGGTGTGSYVLSSSPSGSSIFLGAVQLVITGGLSMSGSDAITIGNGALNDTSSLVLYSGGTSLTIGGNGVLNKAGLASALIVYCAPTVTTVSFSGNGEFTGVLVAPNANVSMNGGGHSDTDFEGALIVNSVTMNGHFHFHYDEALGRMPANGRLLITQWDEVDPKRTPGQ